MTISKRQLMIINIGYCYIPIFLFLCGWCRLLLSIPFCILLLLMFYQYYCVISKQEGGANLVIGNKVLFSVVGVSAVLALILGYGGVFVDIASFSDYIRNGAVVQDLARYSWPVIYEDAKTPSMLTYYLGSYLLPGLIGKIIGSPVVGEIMMGLIGWIGMLLIFLNILFLVDAQTSRMQLLAVVIYLGFYGMLIPLQLLTFWFNDDVILGYPYWFTYPTLQYRSTMVCLKWVWPQYTIPILGMIGLYSHSKFHNLYAIWILPALICGAWAFVALVVYAVCEYVVICVRKKIVYVDIVSWQNVICVLLGMVMLAYLLGCWSSDRTGDMKIALVTDWKYYALSYWPFCLFMFGIYFLLIWKESKKDDFFYITLFLLSVIPFMHAGKYNDWVMGVSMPALFMLAIYVIRFLLNKEVKEKTRKKWIALILFLMISVPYPLLELYSFSFKYTGMPERSMRDFSCIGCEDIPLEWRTYFTNYDYKESFFYKYIARR